MLKQLIQLFAEKFFDKRLNEKKSFIAVQSFPKRGNTDISVQADSAWHSFVAPADGYVSFAGGAQQVLFYNLLGSGVNYATEPRLYRGFIPVTKGSNVFYYIENPTDFTLSFYPVQASG